MDNTTNGMQAAGQMEQAAQAATPPPATDATSPAEASWQQAAQPTTPAQPPQQAPAAPQPVVLTPAKPGGLLGVMQDIGDALTGRSRPELAHDDQGNAYVKQNNLSGGEQWLRIGAQAVKGAAAGLAAGRGAGNIGKAALAGVQSGQQDAAQRQQNESNLDEKAQKENLANANNQMRRMKMAEESWKAARLKVEATQHDIGFAQEQEDRLMKVDGATLLGTAAHPGDISEILHADPDVMKNMIKNHLIEILPHYNPDGTPGGIRVFKMPDGYRKTILPAGTTFHTFDETTGQYMEHKSADPMTAGELDDYETAAGVKAQKFKNDQAELQLKTEQAKTQQTEQMKNRATVAETPSIIGKNNAEAGKARAETGEAAARTSLIKAQTDQLKSQLGAVDGNAPNMTHQQIVDGMIAGKVDITKAVGIFKDPHAREQFIADAMAKDPTFTMQRYQAMLKMREDMTTGKLGDQIQSFNAFLGHAAGVDQGVNALRNANSPLINQPINWLRTNATNNPTIAAMLPEIDATRNEFQNFLTNHALQKSEIERGEQLLSENQSPAAMQAAIKSFMEVAITKLGAVKFRVNQTMGAETPDLITPQNQQNIRGLGLERYANNYGLLTQQTEQSKASQQATAGPVQPGENVATGPKGTVVFRGGTWVDPTTGKAPQ